MMLPDFDAILHGVQNQERRALAKAITLVESQHPEHRRLAGRLIDHLLSTTGKAVRLGITGVPGVGKSTFIEALGMQLVEKGHKVAVLAVDPSSQRTGGSIMADKTRMERLSVQPNAFIRPSPAGRTLGGVGRMTRETMLVCEAAGFDVIIVETVGVGQSETTVASMVDFFLVLMLAGAGDQLQGIKKGVLELADAVVINKADGDNIAKAEKARQEYEAALHLLNPATPTWSPPVRTCSALTLRGVDAVWEVVCTYREKLTATGELAEKRRGQALDWMWALVEEGLRDRFQRHSRVQARLPELGRDVAAGRAAATRAARELLFLLDND
ncbi:MAG: methylmalonyl Co-A mutase-associated GTPase MeaB [Desulfosarcinaceae bacterium]|nr:methylmalonyl Co-A mutase-associated GTPase MeaB [Desulfosarcinaceae bacterium]